MRLEDLQPRRSVRGLHPDGAVTVVGVQWFGSEAVELTYKTAPARWPTSCSTATTRSGWRSSPRGDRGPSTATAPYDIESRDPVTGRLRFIEVKGRRSDAETVTVTRNEILYSLNRPDHFILAVVEFRDDDTHRVRYVRRPFQREPDFEAASVNYRLQDLLAKAEDPR